MEKLKLVIIALFVGMFFSCNSYLDLKPYGQVIPKTPDEFASLLNTMLYDIDYGNDRIIIGNASSVLEYECYADNLDANLTIYPAGNTLTLYVGSALNGMQNTYRNLYEKIRDCNLIIENMKGLQHTAVGVWLLGSGVQVEESAHKAGRRRDISWKAQHSGPHTKGF